MLMRYHMRRMDKAITDEEEMRSILKSTQYVTIAMAKENEPYLVSLSHGYDPEENCIYFHCAKEGKKLDYLEANNVVWGQALIDRGYSQGECNHLYASVHFRGRVTLLEDPEEKWEALALMTRRLDSDPEKLISGRSRGRVMETVVGRIDIEYMTGKKSNGVTL
jgi:nitroimidazol reductase NimA-like FMN-containing flavoprotein (pyridoxamine 5'-phosphate oxidase superfamily)